MTPIPQHDNIFTDIITPLAMYAAEGEVYVEASFVPLARYSSAYNVLAGERFGVK